MRKKLAPTFVVIVRFPGGSKEYAYLCNLSNIGQGDIVQANGTDVTVIRTAATDPRAVRFVSASPTAAQRQNEVRRKEIGIRLRDIELELRNTERLTKLAKASPEARKLVAELKKLKEAVK